MKIIVINSLFAPHRRGGAEVVMAQTVQGLLDLGHEVVVITLADKNDISKEQNDRLTIYRLAAGNIFSFFSLSNKSSWQRLLWHVIDMLNFYQAWRVKKIIKQYQADKIIAHGLKGLGYVSARLVDVLVLHDVQYRVPSGLLWPAQKINFLYRLYGQLVKIIIGSPKTVISPSRWLLNFYGQSGFFQASQKKVLANPITQTLIKNNQTISQPPKLLFVGQLEEHKGIVWLVKTLLATKKDFLLQIVGSGRSEKDLLNIINNDKRFNLVGRRDDQALSEILVTADVLLFPSLVCENSPTIIAQALAAGLPVIASNVGGVKELVDSDWLFIAGDQKTFLEILDKFLADNYQTIKKPPISSPLDYVTGLLSD